MATHLHAHHNIYFHNIRNIDNSIPFNLTHLTEEDHSMSLPAPVSSFSLSFLLLLLVEKTLPFLEVPILDFVKYPE
jgi:hypothetical protein